MGESQQWGRDFRLLSPATIELGRSRLNGRKRNVERNESTIPRAGYPVGTILNFDGCGFDVRCRLKNQIERAGMPAADNLISGGSK